MNDKNFKSTTHSCMVCDEDRTAGISIAHQFICDDCEKEIMHLPTNTQLYSYFIRKLRKISYAAIK